MEQHTITKKLLVIATLIIVGIVAYLIAGKLPRTGTDETTTENTAKPVIIPVVADINYANGAFTPATLTVKTGTQVNFFNKSTKNIKLVSGIEGCTLELKPKESLGCVYREAKTYEVKDDISGNKGTVIAE